MTRFGRASEVTWLWLNTLETYSGDGTLSVLDVRSNKTAPLAQSEDQEDELLSAVAIKGSVNSGCGHIFI